MGVMLFASDQRIWTLVQHHSTQPVPIPAGSRVILVDDSWKVTHGIGIGMVVYNRQGDLVYFHYGKVDVRDPFHAEAEEAYHAIQYAIESDRTWKFSIFSDNLILVRAITKKKWDELPSCRAAETVVKCIQLFNAQSQNYHTTHNKTSCHSSTSHGKLGSKNRKNCKWYTPPRSHHTSEAWRQPKFSVFYFATSIDWCNYMRDTQCYWYKIRAQSWEQERFQIYW